MGLPTDYQNFIATSRYARWLDKEGRRETWDETVTRYVDFIWDRANVDNILHDRTRLKIWKAIYNLEVMPCLLYTSPSPRDRTRSRMPSSA